MKIHRGQQSPDILAAAPTLKVGLHLRIPTYNILATYIGFYCKQA